MVLFTYHVYNYLYAVLPVSLQLIVIKIYEEVDFSALYTSTLNSLEKAMAPHSSTLAWKIPWMEEPGGLQSMGSLRVRHD